MTTRPEDWSTARLDRVRALPPFAVDRPVSLWFAAHRSLTEGHLGLLLARATSPAVLIALVALTAVLLRWRGHRLESTMIAAGTVVAYAAGALGKLGEHRARPLAPVNLAPEAEASFPSGHVLVVTTIAFLALALAWRHLSRAGRIGGTVLATSATVAISTDRLIVGAHWLTDVVGSLALATVVVATTTAAYSWLRASPSSG